MESHGIFSGGHSGERQHNRGRYRGGGGGEGRKVNFSQHDDRGDGGFENNRGGGYNRSRGGNGGRWTRGSRGRDRRGGRNDYSNDHEGGGDNYRDKKRYTPYNTRGYQGSQRSRGDNRGGGKKGSVFSRLGGPDGNRGGGGGVFGRLSGLDDDSSGSHNHDRGNRDTGDWNRGSRGSYNNNRRGSSRGGWQNNTDKPSFQRSDSDFMEEDHSQVLLQVLGERFNSINMSLDLSNMYHDRTLQQHNIRGSMFDGNFVNTVLELISTHCPNLVALDLSKNKLQRLELYTTLKEKCPNLQILDLSENMLKHVNCLEMLGQLNTVTTIMLENNPFQQFHNDFASYAGNIRKFFPNLQILDGQQLPSPVKFDLPSSSGSLPASQKGYLVNEEVRTLVVSFLEQYYTIYDSESRDKLLEAYSDSAVFSMCINIPPHHLKNNPYPQSRNLVRVNETGKRSSLIKKGRIDIVQLLRNLPKSYHVASTFCVDVMRASPVSTAFTVHGIFSEGATGPKADFFPIRSFTRTFVIVAAGNGVAIVNDQLSICTASPQAVKLHQDDVRQHFLPGNMSSQGGGGTVFDSSGGQSAIPSCVSSLPQQPFLPPIPPSYANPQDEAVGRFSATTQMNITWSKKCLEENGWNYDNALTAFNVVNTQGKIPPEAFSQI